MAVTTQGKQLRTFKLLAGLHIAADMDSPKNARGEYDNKTYQAGDVVASHDDLVRKFGHEKFLFVGLSSAATVTDAETDATKVFAEQQQRMIPPKEVKPLTSGELNRMGVADLVKYCEDNEIDMKGATTKPELVKIIRAQ